MVEWNGCHVRNIYSTITKAGTDTTGCGIRGVGDPWGFYVKKHLYKNAVDKIFFVYDY